MENYICIEIFICIKPCECTSSVSVDDNYAVQIMMSKYEGNPNEKKSIECEIQVLKTEVEARRNVLFGDLSSRISSECKMMAEHNKCSKC